MPKLEVKPSLIPDAGLGLFSKRQFYKGDIICEYAGKTVDKGDNMDIYLSDREKYLREIHPYARDLSETEVIIGDHAIANSDLSKSGVYVNDGAMLTGTTREDILKYREKTKLMANVTEIVRDNKIYYLATRRIKRGEEFYASYGEHYWLLLGGVPAEKLGALKMSTLH